MSAKVWTKQLPGGPGLYLRNNPPSCHILKAAIVEIDGVLYNSSCNAGDSMALLSNLSRFWWFGPVPELPDEEDVDD